jgi:hypothetical protein
LARTPSTPPPDTGSGLQGGREPEQVVAGQLRGWRRDGDHGGTPGMPTPQPATWHRVAVVVFKKPRGRSDLVPSVSTPGLARNNMDAFASPAPVSAVEQTSDKPGSATRLSAMPSVGVKAVWWALVVGRLAPTSPEPKQDPSLKLRTTCRTQDRVTLPPHPPLGSRLGSNHPEPG